MLFFAENTNPQYLGKVKLMKLFYYLDFNHVKKHGTSVTGDEYYHLEKGPIPSTIMNMIGELAQDPETSKLASDITLETPAGTRMLRVKGLREFSDKDKKLFTESELQMLREVSERYKNDSTDEMIESSHTEAPWRETKYGQSIPYELAAHDTNSSYTDEEIRFINSLTR